MFTRQITVIGLVQTTTIVLGFVALGVVMKALGWGATESSFRFSALATFLRRYSMVLLLVPMAWTMAACWILSRDESTMPARGITVLGIALCAALLAAYLIGIFSPGYQPILLRAG